MESKASLTNATRQRKQPNKQDSTAPSRIERSLRYITLKVFENLKFDLQSIINEAGRYILQEKPSAFLNFSFQSILRQAPEVHYVRVFRKCNWDDVKSTAPWLVMEAYEDVNDMWEYFCGILYGCLDSYIPLKGPLKIL